MESCKPAAVFRLCIVGEGFTASKLFTFPETGAFPIITELFAEFITALYFGTLGALVDLLACFLCKLDCSDCIIDDDGDVNGTSGFGTTDVDVLEIG